MAANVIRQSDFLNLDRNHWMMRGLVGWWPLQEGAGLKAHDLSPYNETGTLTNMDQSTDWIIGPRAGSALDFDSTDDFVDVVNDVRYTPGQLTVSAWVNFDDMDGQQAIAGVYSNTGNQRSWFFGTDASAAVQQKINFIFSSDGTNFEVWEVSFNDPNVWHHWAATYDGSGGSGVAIYKDGIAQTVSKDQSSGTPSGALHNSTAALRIGRVTAQGSVPNYLDGSLSDVRIWDRALSPSEVRDIYLNPWAPFQQRNQVVVPTITAASIQYIARQIKIQNQRLILK